MSRTVKLGDAKNIKNINKDVKLCYTLSEHISDYAIRLLIANQIPFTKSLITVPFFLREKFHGAKQIYVISTNPNVYGQARRAIDQLEPAYKKRILFSNY